MQGLCMGDIRFTEIQTTFKMNMVPFHIFLQFIKKGSFNADNLPVNSYSHTMMILLAFIPNPCLENIERVGIGNVIQRHGSPLGDIASIHVVIDDIHRILAIEGKKDPPWHRVYLMLIGSYGGHMDFAMDPPYCVAYAVDYKNMMFLPKWHPVNPWTMPSPWQPGTWWWGGYCLCQTGSQQKGNWLRGPPSYSKGGAFWSWIVSGPSHTV